jgi:hypothetical protein
MLRWKDSEFLTYLRQTRTRPSSYELILKSGSSRLLASGLCPHRARCLFPSSLWILWAVGWSEKKMHFVKYVTEKPTDFFYFFCSHIELSSFQVRG